MKQNIPSDTKVFGAGDRKYLPRLEPWQEEIVKYPTPESLSAIQPDYIVFSSGHDIRRFAEDTPEYHKLKIHNALRKENRWESLSAQLRDRLTDWYSPSRTSSL